ncbi:MAG: bifunctional 5,10-methylenetetrahydrofolate dehydrogenase/5,10-methenyltetrahydrofolate cyclohydrolase [Desulfitobacteriia bacterium]|jgi:methylenetetrahydrofolate dehydrogenase (NADP+)/methenyltetrahydrofolate cyclohydrolase
MTLILQAQPVNEVLKKNLKREIAELKAKGKIPTLGMIRVGNQPDDIYYEKSIVKNCRELGIETETLVLAENIENEDLINNLQKFNTTGGIHGIMIFRPLPPHLDEDPLKEIIAPEKDVDCLNPRNLTKIFMGDNSGLKPCTPAAVLEILKHYKINLQGAEVVVAGRSLVVGKPLSMMLLEENATVTICHSRSKNLPELCKRADILIAAIGKAGFFNEKYVTEKSIVIDVGINETEEGTLSGDVDQKAVLGRVQALTPVPGGVGPVTTLMLLKNVVQACRGF